MKRLALVLLVVVAVAAGSMSSLRRGGQGGRGGSAVRRRASQEEFGGGRGGAAGRGGRGGAAFDMTGYWVSVVGEDWRWRTFPARGDYGAVPLNQAARKIAETWDPAKDAAAGEACKAFAAPSVMRIPGRLHITWQDDQTLKIETDAGQQTRLFYFGAPPQAQGDDWQGSSKAEWDLGNAGAGGLFFGGGARGERTVRFAQGRDDADEARIRHPQRRAVQRQCHADGVLRPREDEEWRRVPGADVHAGRCRRT